MPGPMGVRSVWEHLGIKSDVTAQDLENEKMDRSLPFLERSLLSEIEQREEAARSMRQQTDYAIKTEPLDMAIKQAEQKEKTQKALEFVNDAEYRATAGKLEWMTNQERLKLFVENPDMAQKYVFAADRFNNAKAAEAEYTMDLNSKYSMYDEYASAIERAKEDGDIGRVNQYLPAIAKKYGQELPEIFKNGVNSQSLIDVRKAQGDVVISRDVAAKLLELREQEAMTGPTADIQEYRFLQGLIGEDKLDGGNRAMIYMANKRANKYIDTGASIIAADPLDPQSTSVIAEKEVPPQDTPEHEAQVESAKLEAQRLADIKKSHPQQTAKMESLNRQWGVVDQTIDNAVAKIGPYTTGFGGMLSILPQSESRALKNDLLTVRSNIGLSKLQEITDGSPTGGALGNVTEAEHELLQAVNGALDQLDKGENLTANLHRIKINLRRLRQFTNNAFMETYAVNKPVSIKNDDEYEELPTGTVFVGPDGVERVKR